MSGLQNSEKMNLFKSPVVAFCWGSPNRPRQPRYQILGISSWGLLPGVTDLALGGLEHKIQNIRKAQARCGFRLWPSQPGLPMEQSQEISAPGTGPTPGQAMLALPPKPKKRRDRGLSVGPLTPVQRGAAARQPSETTAAAAVCCPSPGAP